VLLCAFDHHYFQGGAVKITVLLFVVMLSVSLALPAFADDGAGLFKAKCAACHGPEGQGKVGPKLAGTTLTADQIATLLTTGNDARKAPHKKPMSSLSADDAKAVATFVTSLK
jgi:mono/diheme cytochrome c family protein